VPQGICYKIIHIITSTKNLIELNKVTDDLNYTYLLVGTLCIDIHRNVDFCNNTRGTDLSETSEQQKVCSNLSTLQHGNNVLGSVTFDCRSLPTFIASVS
jgi:hypothetical protein